MDVHRLGFVIFFREGIFLGGDIFPNQDFTFLDYRLFKGDEYLISRIPVRISLERDLCLTLVSKLETLVTNNDRLNVDVIRCKNELGIDAS